MLLKMTGNKCTSIGHAGRRTARGEHKGPCLLSRILAVKNKEVGLESARN
jgi:hypothetical protein